MQGEGEAPSRSRSARRSARSSSQAAGAWSRVLPLHLRPIARSRADWRWTGLSWQMPCWRIRPGCAGRRRSSRLCAGDVFEVVLDRVQALNHRIRRHGRRSKGLQVVHLLGHVVPGIADAALGLLLRGFAACPDHQRECHGGNYADCDSHTVDASSRRVGAASCDRGDSRWRGTGATRGACPHRAAPSVECCAEAGPIAGREAGGCGGGRKRARGEVLPASLVPVHLGQLDPWLIASRGAGWRPVRGRLVVAVGPMRWMRGGGGCLPGALHAPEARGDRRIEHAEGATLGFIVAAANASDPASDGGGLTQPKNAAGAPPGGGASAARTRRSSSAGARCPSHGATRPAPSFRRADRAQAGAFRDRQRQQLSAHIIGHRLPGRPLRQRSEMVWRPHRPARGRPAGTSPPPVPKFAQLADSLTAEHKFRRRRSPLRRRKR